MSSQIDVFHDCFDGIDDPRVQGRVVHPLNSILLLIVAAVISDADGPEEIECFGHEKVDWLERFADFSAGIPSHDTIGRVLSLIKPSQFQQALLDWHGHLCSMKAKANQDEADDTDDVQAARHVAIDGKTARGSYTDAEKSNAIHIVSAWATEHGITLGQTEVDSKTNEITAIGELMDFIDLKKSIITVDAIGAQKSIATKIIEEGGDYIFAIKDNHPKLAEAIRDHFESVHEHGLIEHAVRSKTTKAKQASRTEQRFYAVGPIPESMTGLASAWKGAKSIGQAITECEKNGNTTVEVRYYLSSRPPRVGEFAQSVRNHWSIESMHWVLDVVFHEDGNRIRTKNATNNFSFVRRYVTTLLKRDTTKRSLKQKRKKAGWNTDFLEKLLFAA